MKKAILAATTAFVLAGSVAAFANGFWTNGLTASLGPRGNETMPADVGLPNSANGAAPQSVALYAAQIAGLAYAQAGSVGTSVAGAVTPATQGGNFAVTTESLSTAVGSTFTETITNSYITATSLVVCSDLGRLSDTTGARFVTQSVTPASGSVVVVWYNNGTAAASGTWRYGCSVFNN